MKLTKVTWRFFPLTAMLLTICTFAKEPIGQISFPLNRVFVFNNQKSNMKYAQFEMEIFNSDRIETRNNSRCEITLKNGYVLRITENNDLVLDGIDFKGDTANCTLNFSAGDLWANSKGDSLNGYFNIYVSDMIISLEDAVCRLSAHKDSVTLHVYDGEIHFSSKNEDLMLASSNLPEIQIDSMALANDDSSTAIRQIGNKTTLSQYQQVIFLPDGQYEISEFDAEEDGKLEWVSWNKRRDQLLGK